MTSPGYQAAARSLRRYQIAEQIGGGGMGVVYRAYDQRLERDVAVKILAPGILADDSARQRFRREAIALSKLNHPNIATVHDFVTEEGVDFLVMEYIAGSTLTDKVRGRAQLEKEVIALGAQLADGLSTAHQHGIVHRDVKPGNLRVTADGRLKLLDFGLAKLRPTMTATATTEGLTQTNGISGTLQYMAPEQLLGGEVDARTDVYAAGLVLYEMATGRHAFAGVPESQIIAAILYGIPTPVTQLNTSLSSGLEGIIAKCLEKDPANRYQAAKELAFDLRRLTMPTAAGPFAARSRRRWSTKLTAVVLATAVLATAAVLLRSRRMYALGTSDTIVLADFVNSTGDAAFDDTLNQALTVDLEQSPFLKILAPAKVQDTLRLMGRSPTEPVTPEVGRELCQRAGSKAVLWGSIATLGARYVLGLTAADCSTGGHLVSEQAEAPTKEAVLKVLGTEASHLRRQLGESLSSVQRFDTPLEQATTSSLEALKAYSKGRKAQYQNGSSAAIPFFKRAIELDPNFAVAYAALGISYSNLGEPGLANQYLQRAFELRDRVSEREKLRISSSYYSYLQGDLIKGSGIYELWRQAYPRDGVPAGNMAVISFYLGQYDKALAQTLEHLRIDGDDTVGYGNLVTLYAALGRLDEAKAAYDQAMARKLDDATLHANRYGVAFLEGDNAEMERHLAWATGREGDEDMLLSFASDTEAFYGRLANARALSLRAIDTARRSGQNETAAGWQMNAALREVEFGNRERALEATAAGLKLASTRDAQILASLAFARAAALRPAQQIAQDLAKRYPHDTVIVHYWLPTIGAAVELSRRNPSRALDLLRATTPYELGTPYPTMGVGASLYPVYLRAQAYLLLGRGVEAGVEYQKMLAHRGITVNCPLGALARLGLARAYVLQNDAAHGRSQYEEFFNLWKQGDTDIPIARQARAEYAKLR